MATPQHQGTGPDRSGVHDISTPSDFFAILLAIGVAIPIVTGLALTAIQDAGTWLVDNGILAPPTDDPLVPLGFVGGAGLDVPRLVIALAVLATFVLIAHQLVLPYRRKARLRHMRQGDI